MYIGKDGVDFVSGLGLTELQQTSSTTWRLILQAKGCDFSESAEGLRCTLAKVGRLAVALDDSPHSVRRKILALGHSHEPAVLKTGSQEEIIALGYAVVRLVCPCHFSLVGVPS